MSVIVQVVSMEPHTRSMECFPCKNVYWNFNKIFSPFIYIFFKSAVGIPVWYEWSELRNKYRVSVDWYIQSLNPRHSLFHVAHVQPRWGPYFFKLVLEFQQNFLSLSDQLRIP